LYVAEKNIGHCLPNTTSRAGSGFAVTAAKRLVDWGIPHGHHSSLFPPQATVMNQLFLLQCTKPFSLPLIPSPFTAP